MEKAELEELRGKLACGAVLETAGFTVDLKESTSRAVKYRRGDDMIIVIHDGQEWFDPRPTPRATCFVSSNISTAFPLRPHSMSLP